MQIKCQFWLQPKRPTNDDDCLWCVKLSRAKHTKESYIEWLATKVCYECAVNVLARTKSGKLLHKMMSTNDRTEMISMHREQTNLNRYYLCIRIRLRRRPVDTFAMHQGDMCQENVVAIRRIEPAAITKKIVLNHLKKKLQKMQNWTHFETIDHKQVKNNTEEILFEPSPCTVRWFTGSWWFQRNRNIKTRLKQP